jgi:hypothetical protein
MIDYLKVGKATELEGRDKFLYRIFEILPGFLAWGTLIGLVVLSFFQPVWVAYFVIFFDVYWLLLVLYLAIHLFVSSAKMQKNRKVDWIQKCKDLNAGLIKDLPEECLREKGFKTDEIIHVILMPTLNEPAGVVEPSIQSIIDDGFPTKNMIFVLGLEEREDPKTAIPKGEYLKNKFGDIFITVAVYASPNTRFKRLKNRFNERPIADWKEFKARDWTEIEGTQKGGPIAIADYTLVNESTKENFQKQIVELFEKLV